MSKLTDPQREALLRLTDARSPYGGPGHLHAAEGDKQSLDALVRRGLVERPLGSHAYRSTEQGEALARQYREFVVHARNLATAITQVRLVKRGGGEAADAALPVLYALRATLDSLTDPTA